MSKSERQEIMASLERILDDLDNNAISAREPRRPKRPPRADSIKLALPEELVDTNALGRNEDHCARR
jgi:hypothetical protein